MRYYLIYGPAQKLKKISRSRAYDVLYNNEMILILKDAQGLEMYQGITITQISEIEYLNMVAPRTVSIKAGDFVVCINGRLKGFHGIARKIDGDQVYVEFAVYGAMNLEKVSISDIRPLSVEAL